MFHHHSPLARLRRAAGYAALLILGCGAASAQLNSHSGPNRPRAAAARTAQVLPGASNSGFAASTSPTASSAYERIRSLPMSDNLVGAGADFDGVKWVLKRPVFFASVANNPVPSGQSVYFEERVNNTATSSGASTSVGLEYDAGLVSAAAGMTLSKSLSTSQFGASMSLIARNDYLDEVVNPASTAVRWSHEALAIMSIPNVALRTALWQQYFGRFVIVGKSYAGEIGVTLEVADFSKHSGSSLSAFFEAGYSPVGNISADFDSFLQQGAAASNLSLKLHNFASQPLDMVVPELKTMKSPVARANFINGLLAQLNGRWRSEAYVAVPANSLLPWSSTPGGPSFASSWNSGHIDLARNASATALETLRRAWRYNYPQSLRSFLDDRLNPTTNHSFAADLDQSRAALIAELGDLGARFRSYFQGNNAADPAYVTALSNAANEVILANANLQTAIDSIGPGGLGSTLPQPTIVGATPWYSSIQQGNSGNPRSAIVDIEIDNVAIFHDGDLQDLGMRFHTQSHSYEGWPKLLNVWARGSGCEWGSFWSALGGDHIAPPIVVDVYTYPSGAAEGLKRIRLRAPMVFGECTRELRLQITDMLDRSSVWQFHDLADDSTIWNS